MQNDFSRTVINSWLYETRYLVYLVLIAWIVSIVNFGLLGGSLNHLGIRPRSLGGLQGILFAPFLHGDWAHIEGNTIGFATFGGLILLQDPSNFGAVTTIVALTSGIGTWLVGEGNRSGKVVVHIGASGVVFGYLGFLFSLAYFDRSLSSASILVLLSFFYSKYLWGILPLQEGISWEEHLFGF
ncbi:MAG: rhomboid family intramembrane serine protease [Leptolyngbyaceae cyanobacterium CSU_1_3]|nr:rhomboid family intramembrane serine protease [Leptolyngbyaceae cyanobacterium CSU_1_3]